MMGDVEVKSVAVKFNDSWGTCSIAQFMCLMPLLLFLAVCTGSPLMSYEKVHQNCKYMHYYKYFFLLLTWTDPKVVTMQYGKCN